jgi:hypothetical protein
MRQFQIEPAELFEPDQNAYLDRQLHSINNVLLRTNYYTPIYNIPNKPRIGMVFYFGEALVDTDITGEGLWVFTSQGWKPILEVQP